MGFDPVTIGLVGAGISAIAAAEAASARSANANYQAQVARNNSTIALQRAEYAAQAGAEKETQTSLRGAAAQGQIRSAIAAHGVDVNTGSPVDVEESAAKSTKLDTETEAANTALRVYGYRAEATGDTAEAGLLSSEADQAIEGGVLGSAGSLLENASSIGFRWRGSQQPFTSGYRGGGGYD